MEQSFVKLLPSAHMRERVLVVTLSVVQHGIWTMTDFYPYCLEVNQKLSNHLDAVYNDLSAFHAMLF